jgi:hypothetical protein
MSRDCYPVSPLVSWLDLQKTHVTWSLSTVLVTAPHMRKLHGHKENTAAVLLVVSVLRALPGNGFTCHNIKFISLGKQFVYDNEKSNLNWRERFRAPAAMTMKSTLYYLPRTDRMYYGKSLPTFRMNVIEKNKEASNRQREPCLLLPCLLP